MKVLLVSHTALSKTNNMGKTLLSYLSGFEPGEIAQFYIHSEVPTDDSVCVSYYRFTDIDALKTVINPWHSGCSFESTDIARDRMMARTDEGMVSSAYVLGSKRKAWTMIMRELIWMAAHWKQDAMKKWVDTFSPDVILFASGDYGFMYDIALWFAEYTKKPLISICVDDHYIYQRNADSLLGRIHYRSFIRKVRATMERSECIFTLSDAMNEAYTKLFNKACYTIHNSVYERELAFENGRHQISYIGNLGYGRVDQLVSIGEALASLARTEAPTAIDVYTASRNEAYLEKLRTARGVRLHAAISFDGVLDVMKKSIATIHTESFDDINMNLVRYSVSTKIAESLMYGPCLFAYGPEGIASIDYLRESKAAHVVTSEENLKKGLLELLTNKELRSDIEQQARKIARENHNAEKMPLYVRRLIANVIEAKAK